jgi:hypothetical protein
MKKLRLIFIFLCLITGLSGLTPSRAESVASVTPTVAVTSIPVKVDGDKKTQFLVAEIVDAADLQQYSKTDASNTQMVTLEIKDNSKSSTLRIDTSFTFPTNQFKRPLKIGDKVIVELSGELSTDSTITIVSLYRQNNLLVWGFILIGLFILVAGFRANLKYFQIFLITIVSGVIVLIFYHKSTYLTFGLLFLWQFVATVWFSFRIFQKRTPALVLCLGLLGNQLLAMGLIFVMKNINIFDIGFFELFFPSIHDAREVMMYVFAVLVLYPIAVVFAEQVISESIKKKREENDILKIKLIRYVSRSALKGLNNLFLTFFGLFFAIFVCVMAIASYEKTVFTVVNSAALSQMLSVGFLILFDLLIFIPLISFMSGMWLGTLESHQLVTDKNLRQLEL